MYLPRSSTAEQAFSLEKRFGCYNYNTDGTCGDSTWDNWGRFALLGGVVAFILIICVICGCTTARRRRARGAQPYYGTGWMANNHGAVNYYGQNQAQPGYSGYNNNNAGYGGAPPQYAYGNSNSYGYYGNRDNVEPGLELQSPPAAYTGTYQQAGDNVYQPPAGPPPGKGDVVR